MLSNKEPEYCEVQKKVCLSEAGASRRVHNYQEIERYYHCRHCGHYHITSSPDLFDDGEEDVNFVDPKLIEERLKEIERKLT